MTSNLSGWTLCANLETSMTFLHSPPVSQLLQPYFAMLLCFARLVCWVYLRKVTIYYFQLCVTYMLIPIQLHIWNILKISWNCFTADFQLKLPTGLCCFQVMRIHVPSTFTSHCLGPDTLPPGLFTHIHSTDPRSVLTSYCSKHLTLFTTSPDFQYHVVLWMWVHCTISLHINVLSPLLDLGED